MKLSVIIPCYNEEKTLRNILDQVIAVNISPWEKEIIVINDSSKDGSKEIIDEYAKNGFIRAIHLEKNSGKGTAVKTGLLVASGDFMLIQDADLEYDPKDYPRLLSCAKTNKTVVYGSRNLSPETERGGFIARLGGILISKMITILYGTRITDALTCYKLFPKEAISFFDNGGFESENLFTPRVLDQGYSIVEIPISYYPRKFEEGKKIRYSDGFLIIYTILCYWLKTLFTPSSKK